MWESPWGSSPIYGILEYWCDTLLYLSHCIDTIKEEIKLYYQKKVLLADFQTQKCLQEKLIRIFFFFISLTVIASGTSWVLSSIFWA